MSITGAFIVPHPPILLSEIGKGEEKALQATLDAFSNVSLHIQALDPETIVLLSPHAVSYADYFHISPGKRASGDLARFGAAQVSVDALYDIEFRDALLETVSVMSVPAGTQGGRDPSLDHGAIIPLRLLSEAVNGRLLVRIGLSGLSPLIHYKLGKCIAQTAAHLKRNTVLLASGDLSHKLRNDGPYGFSPEGPLFDKRVTEAMAEGSFLDFLKFEPGLTEAAAECGLKSFIIMAGALNKKAVSSKLLSYEGTFGVGYAVASFIPLGEAPERDFDEQYSYWRRESAKAEHALEGEYAALARLSLETYVITGRKAKLPENLPEQMLKTRAGVFVTLKKDGKLRGCIGTIAPVQECVGAEILTNAISAGLDDTRFDPVTEDELNELSYSVDVLEAPEPISSEAELDPKTYGVIVSAGYRRGLLLPNIEGIETAQEQVAIAKRKAGIRDGDKAKLERFKVIRHT